MAMLRHQDLPGSATAGCESSRACCRYHTMAAGAGDTTCSAPGCPAGRPDVRERRSRPACGAGAHYLSSDQQNEAAIPTGAADEQPEREEGR